MLTLLYRFSAIFLLLQQDIKFRQFIPGILLNNTCNSRNYCGIRHFDLCRISRIYFPGVVLYTSLNASMKTAGRQPDL